MPRKREGSAVKHGGHFDVRITLPSGERGNKMCLPPGTSYARAKEKARHLSELAAKEGAVRVRGERSPTNGTTLAEWGERWFADRKARGMTSVRADTGHFSKRKSARQPEYSQSKPSSRKTRIVSSACSPSRKRIASSAEPSKMISSGLPSRGASRTQIAEPMKSA